MTEKTISSTLVYEGGIMTVRRDEVITASGKKGLRETVSHNGGAAVLAVKDGKAIIERQYRYVINKEIYEIPAGKRDGAEDFAVTAARELEEETGYKPLDLKKITDFYPSPGYTNEVIAIYLATELSKGEKHFDDTEFLTSEWVELEKLYDMIDRGEITDSKTLIALLWYKAFGENGR